MPLEPTTHFADRINAVAEALRMTFTVPTVGPEMIAADKEISDAIAEIEAHYEPIKIEDCTAAGEQWAKAKKRSFADIDKLIQSPTARSSTTTAVYLDNQWNTLDVSTPEWRRFDAFRDGALKALIAMHDKPEFDTAALIESCRPEINEWFEHMGNELNESVKGLSDEELDKAKPYIERIFDLIDPASTPESTITAYRRAVRAWNLIDHGDSENVVRALAFHDVRPADTLGSEEGAPLWQHVKKFVSDNEFVSHTPGYFVTAQWYSPELLAYQVFGGYARTAIAKGLGRVVPLADPLGEDIDEFERRLEAVAAAQKWWADCEHSKRTNPFDVNTRYYNACIRDAPERLAEFKEDQPEWFETDTVEETDTVKAIGTDTAGAETDPAETIE